MQVIVRKFISWLILPIIFGFYLYKIIRQMYSPLLEPSWLLLSKLIFEFFGQRIPAIDFSHQMKRIATGSYVAFSVPISFEAAINAS